LLIKPTRGLCWQSWSPASSELSVDPRHRDEAHIPTYAIRVAAISLRHPFSNDRRPPIRK
jgi:hypothetical protein